MASLFLSYARDDTARLRPLAQALEAAGHTVWWDDHIRGGEQFADAIETALESADVVLVAWSAASVKSPWVRDEAAVGRDGGRLLPVTLDGSQPPIGFRQFQTIDLSSWKGKAGDKSLERLLDALETKAGAAAAPQPPRAARPAAPSTPRRRLVVGAGALAAALAAGVVIFDPWGGSGAISPKVALGEFAVASPDVPRQLSDALNNEILAAFGSEHEVSVITAGASRARAPFVLDGSIRKSADALHFTVNLKNIRSGELVWSRSFDRALIDTLAPRQVAVAASQVVRCGLWGASGYRKPMSDEALSLYLQWCDRYWGGSPDENQILDAAKRVTAEVPDFSFGWSALALAAVPISHRADYAGAKEVARQGWEAAEKATRLDAKNPEGYMAQAGLLPMSRFAERERLLTKAIAVRPTECGCERQAYGDFLMSVGRLEEAAENYERARAMMPLAPMSNVRVAQALYATGRQREGDSVIARMLDLWPEAETVRLLQVKAAFWTRNYAEAIPLLNAPELHLPDDEREALIHALEALKSGDRAAGASAAGELASLASDPRRNDRLVVAALAALGAEGPALAAADALIRERGPALADVLFEPNLARFRSAPQYAQLVSKLGLAAYWRSGGALPDFCKQPDRPAFCSR